MNAPHLIGASDIYAMPHMSGFRRHFAAQARTLTKACRRPHRYQPGSIWHPPHPEGAGATENFEMTGISITTLRGTTGHRPISKRG